MILQDVSDRIEKIDFQHDPLKTLEKNSKYITRDDWNLHLDESITSDLRKYRAYQGNSVRDLLRALRNKVWFQTQQRISVLNYIFNEMIRFYYIFFLETSLSRIDAGDAGTIGSDTDSISKILD